jgi:hypothetical protein
MHNNPIKTELEAWLTLLTTQDMDTIEELITSFEGFGEIYREVFQLRTKPEELIQMYDNIFYEADRNEDRLLIEEMKDTIAEREAALAERDATIAEKDSALAEQDSLIRQLQAENQRLRQLQEK